MLMMRLQRVGRRNDPSFRIVVTDKRTGPKSDKHVDRLGSYNPKLNHVQLDAEKAKEWLAKGVQPSDTLYNILVGEGVVEGRKKNVLPKKSPVVKEEAEKAEEAPAEATEETTEEAAEAETTEEAPAKEEKAEEAPAEAESKEETKEEPVAEEKAEEPAEEKKEEEQKEEDKETEEEKKD